MCGSKMSDIILFMIYHPYSVVVLLCQHSHTLSLSHRANSSQKAKLCPQTFRSRVLHKLREYIQDFNTSCVMLSY